eukprot:1132091-Pelagomonas_calceolata.AAC.1
MVQGRQRALPDLLFPSITVLAAANLALSPAASAQLPAPVPIPTAPPFARPLPSSHPIPVVYPQRKDDLHLGRLAMRAQGWLVCIAIAV